MPVIRRPTVSMVIPASRMTWRSAQSITLGPSTAADLVSVAPRSSCSSASGAGSLSSCSSHSHSTRSLSATPAGSPTGTVALRWVTARATAAP